MKTPKHVIRAWADGFNRRDAEAVAACYHDDAENLQVATGVPIKGKAAILADLKEFFAHNPDSTTKVENLFEDGEWAIIEWSGAGTFVAEPGAAGRPYTLRGCGFFHVVDGKIRFQRGYWDKATWFSQVGIPIQ